MIFQLGKKNSNTQDSDRVSHDRASQGQNLNSGNQGFEMGNDPAFIQSGSGFSAAGAENSNSAAETVRRWREAAAIARSTASSVIEDGEPELPPGKHGLESSNGEGSQLSVEWPDPRAAITLNKPLPGQGISPNTANGSTGPVMNGQAVQTPPLPPVASKPEGGSLVSRTFPFFRSSSSSAAAAAASAPVTSNVTPANSQGLNSQANVLPGQVLVNGAQSMGQAVTGGGVMSGNAMSSQATSQTAEAISNVVGRNPAWKDQRPGAPGDVISAIKGRTQMPPEEEIRARFGTNIKSALGPGTIIEGKFRFDSPVSIEGTLIGEVTSNSVLIVGSQATVTAKINVGSLIILGRVHGDVDCEELLEIKSTGHLEGDVRSKRIAIDDGGWFRGLCTPTGKPETSDI